MNSIYKNYTSKSARFNEWEQGVEAGQSEAQKISEFCHLFELAMQMPPEIIERAQHIHLQNLIDDQKRLMGMKKIKFQQT